MSTSRGAEHASSQIRYRISGGNLGNMENAVEDASSDICGYDYVNPVLPL